MIIIKNLKVNPINNYSDRFSTSLKKYKRLLIFILLVLFISSYVTGKTFDSHLKEDTHIYTTN